MLGEIPEDEVLALAAAVEDLSEHPLARAVVAEAEARGIEQGECQDFKSVPGTGVSGKVGKSRILVGTTRYMAADGIDTGAARDLLIAHEEKAQTAVLAAVDGKAAGIIAISDAIKPDAAQAVAMIKARGMTPLLVTGNNERTAARQVGIDEVRTGAAQRKGRNHARASGPGRPGRDGWRWRQASARFWPTRSVESCAGLLRARRKNPQAQMFRPTVSMCFQSPEYTVPAASKTSGFICKTATVSERFLATPANGR